MGRSVFHHAPICIPTAGNFPDFSGKSPFFLKFLTFKLINLSSYSYSTVIFYYCLERNSSKLYGIFTRMESEDGVSQQPKLVGGKLYWSTSMDDCMLEVFLSHLAQGVGLLLVGKSPPHIMLSRSGFGWDSDTMILIADERVWDEALKANPNLKTYKKKLLPRFNEWMDVLGDNSANGNIQKTCFTTDVDAHVEDSTKLTSQHSVDPLLGSSMTFETINLDEDGGTQHVSGSPTLPRLPKTKKLPQRKRKSLAMGLKEEMGNMHETMETFVDVLKEKNRYDDIIWDQVSAAIYSIEYMDEDTKVKALELFSGEHVENRKRCFLRIPDHKRKGWLLKKFNKVDV